MFEQNRNHNKLEFKNISTVFRIFVGTQNSGRFDIKWPKFDTIPFPQFNKYKRHEKHNDNFNSNIFFITELL